MNPQLVSVDQIIHATPKMFWVLPVNIWKQILILITKYNMKIKNMKPTVRNVFTHKLFYVARLTATTEIFNLCS